LDLIRVVTGDRRESSSLLSLFPMCKPVQPTSASRGRGVRTSAK
jgi:hypothetical protein